MSVAVKNIEGIESVEVSLEKGSADIRLKPGNRVTLAALRRVIKQNGYPTKDAQIEARGRFVDSGQTTVLDLLNGSTMEISGKPAGSSAGIVVVSGTSRSAGKDGERLTITAVK